jgi:hypothetical protein
MQIMASEAIGDNQRAAKRQKLGSDDGWDADAFFEEGLWENGFESEVWLLYLAIYEFSAVFSRNFC